MARFGGVHAFGYNFAKSEPIWIKSGALLHSRGLALADFGRDQRSINSCRARRNFVFLSGKHRTMSPISRLPNFRKFEHNTSIGVATNFGTEFLNVTGRGSFFPQKCKKFHNFNVLRL